MYQTLLRMAAKGLRQGPPDYDEMTTKTGGVKRLDVQQLWQRDVGDMIPHLAMAYLLSGNTRYLNGAKEWMFASLNYPTWGLEKWDGMDLAAGHQLTGIGLAFDWLYNDLNRNERMQIRNKLSARAGKMARKVLNGEAWWADKYLQNHPWVNLAGLATTAFALYGLEDEAAGWIHAAHEVFLTTLETLGHDGASHEGYGYWEYGTEFILRYLEMAHGLMNINLYENDTAEHPWLKNSMLYALHLIIPVNGWSNQGSVIDLGNSTRKHWYGPSYILRKLAQRFPRSGSAGLAQWLADEIVEKNIDEPHAGQYLNLLWYEPVITAIKPDQTASTLHHFEDIGIVDARSNWSGDETQLIVKCGPPLGHEHIDFPYDYGANHVHPDAGHFTIVKGGAFLIKDDGYSRMLKKQTAYHNTLLVDGQGQKGEGGLAFDLDSWFEERQAPKIVSVDKSNRKDVIICDVAPAYPKKLGLRQFDRTFTFYKPNKIEVDDVVAASKNVTFEWRIHLGSKGQKISDNHFRMKHNGQQVDFYIDSEKNIDTYIGEFQKDQFIGIVTMQKERNNQIKFTLQLQ